MTTYRLPKEDIEQVQARQAAERAAFEQQRQQQQQQEQEQAALAEQQRVRATAGDAAAGVGGQQLTGDAAQNGAAGSRATFDGVTGLLYAPLLPCLRACPHFRLALTGRILSCELRLTAASAMAP
jgi:hypothetical protein